MHEKSSRTKQGFNNFRIQLWAPNILSFSIKKKTRKIVVVLKEYCKVFIISHVLIKNTSNYITTSLNDLHSLKISLEETLKRQNWLNRMSVYFF